MFQGVCEGGAETDSSKTELELVASSLNYFSVYVWICLCPAQAANPKQEKKMMVVGRVLVIMANGLPSA